MNSDEGMWNVNIDLRTGIEAAKEAGLHEKVFDLQLNHLTAHMSRVIKEEVGSEYAPHTVDK